MSEATIDETLVARRVCGRNLLRLEWIRRRAGSTGLEWDERAAGPVIDLVDAVRDHSTAADRVLADPRFGRWAEHLIRLIDRSAPSLLPDGDFAASCLAAGAFAAAVRLNAGDERATLVRVGPGGRTALPGSGYVLRSDPALVGHQIEVPGRLAQLALEPTPLPGLAVDEAETVDLDACRQVRSLRSAPVVVVVQKGVWSPTDVAAPGLAVLPAGLSRAERTAFVLAAAKHLEFSVVAAEQPGTALTVAAAAPPELEAVSTPDQIQRLIALHAALVELAPGRTHVVADVLRGLACWLADDGRTPYGDEVAGWLGAAGFPTERGYPPAAASELAMSWQDTWKSLGGRLRADRDHESHLRAENNAVLTNLLSEVGSGGGIAINTLGLRRIRTDQTFDHLSLMAARDADRYDRFTARLATAGGAPAARLLRGHCAYIEQRFADALVRYDELLQTYPYNIDLWRDAAFTLRHLHRYELCDTWVFQGEAVAERADLIEADPDTLQAALPDFIGPDSCPSLSALLLEWVRRDLDPR
jgi:hypothetical protein